MQKLMTLSYTIPKKKFNNEFYGLSDVTFFKKRSRKKLDIYRIKTDTSRQV